MKLHELLTILQQYPMDSDVEIDRGYSVCSEFSCDYINMTEQHVGHYIVKRFEDADTNVVWIGSAE